MAQVIQLSDGAALEHEVRVLSALFEQKETEDNWTRMEDALARFAAVTRGSSHLPGFVGVVKVRLKGAICNSLNSERTRLSRAAMTLVETLARTLGDRFEPLSDTLCPVVLRLATRANRVYVSCASGTVKACIESAGMPSFLPSLVEAMRNPSKSLRQTAVDCVITLVSSNPPHRLEPYAESLEAAIREGVVDADAVVREVTKKVFMLYADALPARVDRFVTALPAAAKKNLRLDKIVSKPRGVIPPRGRSLQTTSVPKPAQRGPLAIDTAHQPDHDENMWQTSLSPEPDSTNSYSQLPIPHTSPPTDLHSSQFGPRRVFSGAERVQTDFGGPSGLKAPSRAPHIAGAQRVMVDERQAAEEPLIARSKAPSRALRVPASEVQAISPPAARLAEESRGKQYKRRVTTVFGMGPAIAAALKRPESAASTAHSNAGSDYSRHQEEVTIDINHLVTKHRSHDWSARAKVQDTLLQYIATATPNDFRSKTMNKATDILLAGLADQHFKVVQSSLSGLYEMLKLNDNISEDVLAQILPRVAVAVYSPQAKVKPGVLENGEKVVQLCKEKYRGEVLCGAMAQALLQPELGKVPKMRIGCVGLLTGFGAEEWGPYVAKVSNVKTMMIRLTPLTQEPDPAVQRNLRYVFQSMHEANPDTFWSALSGLKPGDKRVINMLFGKDIVADKSALIKTAKPMSPAPASPAFNNVRALSPNGGGSPLRAPKSPMRPSPLKINPNRSSILAKSSPKIRVVPPVLARRLSRSRSRDGEDMRVDDLTLEELDMSHVADLEVDDEAKTNPPPSASDDWVSEADARSNASEAHGPTFEPVGAGSLGLGRLREGPIPPTAQDAIQLATGQDPSERSYSPRLMRPNGSAIPVAAARTISPRVDSLPPSPRSSRRLSFKRREPLRLDESEESTTWARGRRNSMSGRRRKSIDGMRKLSAGSGASFESEVAEEVLKGAASEIDKTIEERRRSYGTPTEVKETVTDFVDRVAEAVEKMVSAQQLGVAASPQGRASPLLTQKPLSVIDAVRMELANRVQATRIGRERREERERKQEESERNKRGLSWDSKVLSPDNLQEVLFAAAADDESWGDAPGDTLTPHDVMMEPPTGMAAVVTVVKKKRRSLWENRANGIVDTILDGMQEKKNVPVMKNCLVVLKELVLNQFDLITDRTTDVFLGVLKCETYGGCSAEDFLEIALEIDSVLKAFERSAPGPALRSAIAAALTEGVGVRVSFEILARVLAGPGWVNIVGDMGEDVEGEPEHEKEERKARKIHEAIIVEHISKGLVSRKSAMRAAAFAATVALVKRRGAAVSDRLYEAVGREGGEARVFTLKEMVERRSKEE